MQAEHVLTASFLDLVFDGRNKAYGAYDLRQSYPRRLAKALGLVFGLTAILVVATQFVKPSKMSAAGVFEVSDTLVFVDLDPKPVAPVQPVQPQPQVATAHVTPPLILPDALVPPDAVLPDVETIDKSQIGLENIDGQPADNTVAANSPQISTGLAVAAPVVEQATDTIFGSVDIQAQFPGGLAAWRRYLERHMRYPEAAQENGTQGPVQVQFVVDRDGNINEVVALNDPGDGIAAEAVRIISQGPKWKPAEQNGRLVSSRHVQGIVFQLQ